MSRVFILTELVIVCFVVVVIVIAADSRYEVRDAREPLAILSRV
jgi:hypothetical protein